MNKELKDMSEVEIKAAVYDRIAVIEKLSADMRKYAEPLQKQADLIQAEIKALNEELAKRAKEAQAVTPEVVA